MADFLWQLYDIEPAASRQRTDDEQATAAVSQPHVHATTAATAATTDGASNTTATADGGWRSDAELPQVLSEEARPARPDSRPEPESPERSQAVNKEIKGEQFER